MVCVNNARMPDLWIFFASIDRNTCRRSKHSLGHVAILNRRKLENRCIVVLEDADSSFSRQRGIPQPALDARCLIDSLPRALQSTHVVFIRDNLRMLRVQYELREYSLQNRHDTLHRSVVSSYKVILFDTFLKICELLLHYMFSVEALLCKFKFVVLWSPIMER